ncbi:unnamed protein product [Clavelina lepadiformis]|uniref:EF-hand domain-containing protein n=1 Tax=Clavelina lepadiformis TaxID=159417 RepID=A0ABP0FE37_CLALP
MEKQTDVKKFPSQPKVDPSELTLDHIHDIRTAVVCLLDVIASIINKRHDEVCDSYKSLTQDAKALNETVFAQIRDRYLWWCSGITDEKSMKRPSTQRNPNKPMLRSVSMYGQLTFRYSRVEADRFLRTLISAFEACRTVLLQSLKRRSQRETNLYEQLLQLKGDLKQKSDELSLANIKLDYGRRERDSWNSQLDDLKQKLDAAEKKILQLEKSANVMLWQNKLKEVEGENQTEIEKLKEAAESEKKNYEETCTKLRAKIKRLENDVGRLKLKQELPLIPSSSGLVEKLDHTKRQLFLRDQEIYMLKKELTEQRKLMSACINGLQQDFKHLLKSWEYEAPGKKFSPDSSNVKYQAMLRFIDDACTKGTWEVLQENLPSHYKSKEMTEKNNLPKPKHLTVTNIHVRPSSSNVYKSPSTSPLLERRPQSAQCIPLSGGSHNKPIPSHPQLVSKVTGRANLVQIMKHFPYLTVEQVTRQWENFRKYDKNNDFSLDLPELYEVITEVLGLNISVQEMKEAMHEVDRDKSNNIDFYEYLKIAEMIFKKQGDSAIFKSDMLLEKGISTSKECIVQ